MKLAAALLVALAATAAHADELAIEPTTAKCTTGPEVTIAIEVVAHGAWLGSSTGARCFVPRKGNALDDAALDTELATLVASLTPDCSTSVEVAAAPGVAYQDVITAIDHAIKAGLTQVALTDPKSAAIKFDDTAAKEKAAPHCAAPASSAHAKATAAASKPGAPAPIAAKPDLAAAPVVIVSRTDVTLAGASIGSVKTIARGKGAIAALVRALRATKAKGPIVLQADASTDAAVLNRVITSAHDAGFADVLFAVRSK